MGFDGDDDFSDTIAKTSKYNGAISQLYRLDELWRDAHKHSRTGELEKWNWDLDRVWCELAGDFDEDHKNNETFEGINKEIGDLKVKLSKLQITKGSFITEYYVLLNKKELFLRRLQNNLGKGTEYEDEDDIME